MAMAQQGKEPQKLCFVTIGATAAFDGLVRAVFDSSVLSALQAGGYSKLLVQYGKDGKALFETLSQREQQKIYGVNFEGFDFDTDGLTQYMVEARRSGGCVVSHGGSGSILEALRTSVPLVVVPNPDLLDNHQDELAEELAKQGYVVHGKLNELASAISEVEALAKRHKQWPPVNSGVHRQAEGLQGVIDEELGYLD